MDFPGFLVYTYRNRVQKVPEIKKSLLCCMNSGIIIRCILYSKAWIIESAEGGTYGS